MESWRGKFPDIGLVQGKQICFSSFRSIRIHVCQNRAFLSPYILSFRAWIIFLETFKINLFDHSGSLYSPLTNGILLQPIGAELENKFMQLLNLYLTVLTEMRRGLFAMMWLKAPLHFIFFICENIAMMHCGWKAQEIVIWVKKKSKEKKIKKREHCPDPESACFVLRPLVWLLLSAVVVLENFD